MVDRRRPVFHPLYNAASACESDCADVAAHAVTLPGQTLTHPGYNTASTCDLIGLLEPRGSQRERTAETHYSASLPAPPQPRNNQSRACTAAVARGAAGAEEQRVLWL